LGLPGKKGCFQAIRSKLSHHQHYSHQGKGAIPLCANRTA